jgi:cytidylate kinase
MPVVTLSREYGSGGGVVGRGVAELLQADLLDSELCDEVARRLQIPPQAVQRWEERKESVILRLLRTLESAQPEAAVGSPTVADVVQRAPDPERVWAVVQEVIREEARTRSAVIVGRGGAFILAGWPGVYHFRLVAPRDWRIRRMSGLTRLTLEEATRRVDAADRDRAAFLRYRFGAGASEAHHFHLVLNTMLLGLEQTIRIIAQVATSESA